MNNQELNQKLYDVVREWCINARLVMSGVNLADCMAYDALSVMGRQIISAQDETQKQGEVQNG